MKPLSPGEADAARRYARYCSGRLSGEPRRTTAFFIPASRRAYAILSPSPQLAEL
ncbi:MULTISPECIES: hypothetical protein [Dickeya]|uniref:hypothetical protein n=1 Tax=Dickeya TaxID=204037 RepID=UPI000A6BA65A|nr:MULTISPECIES: hypothetical protein [Dickeya]